MPRNVFLLVVLSCFSMNALADTPTMIDVYTSGRDGYHTYRIPAIVVTKAGTVLAFAEGRKNSKGDSGDIDMFVKRSTDGGLTWSAQQLVWDDGENTCGNPCAVVDQTTGTIWLLMTHNPGDYHEFKSETYKGTRTVWVTHSTDDGLTWTEPTEITATTKDSNWEWYATGPGIGIQLQHGPHAGRLLIPANHSYAPDGKDAISIYRNGYGIGAHAIYSDDGGKTWRRSDNTVRPGVNESQLVELSDGRVMTNMRAYFEDARRRYALSDDGGTTWGEALRAEELIEPVCQASILRVSWPKDGEPGVILFSNPANEKKRSRMTVRASFDDGRSWPVSRLIHEDSGAYSCLVVLPDGEIGCFFERNVQGAMTLTLAKFPLSWATGGSSE